MVVRSAGRCGVVITAALAVATMTTACGAASSQLSAPQNSVTTLPVPPNLPPFPLPSDVPPVPLPSDVPNVELRGDVPRVQLPGDIPRLGACQMVCVSPVNGRIAGRDNRQGHGWGAG